MIQTDDIMLFARVAELSSFTAAAQELDVSRSLVSKRIRALEERLGVRLLNRSTRSLSLTEPGQLFYDCAVRVRETLADTTRRLGELGERPRGRLRINVPVTFGQMYVAPLMGAFLERYPDIEVDMHMDDHFVDLVQEGYDAALRIGILEDSSLVARRVGSTRRVVCASPTYLRAHGTPRSPADLRHHNCLTYHHERGRSGAWQFLGGPARETVPVSGNLRCSNGVALLEAARSGLGLAYLPRFMLAGDLAQGRLQEVLHEHCREELGIYALYPSHAHPPAKVRAFVDFLVQRLGAQPGLEPG